MKEDGNQVKFDKNLHGSLPPVRIAPTRLGLTPTEEMTDYGLE